MSLMPDTPPEPGTLHDFALNYRTALMHSDVVSAWVKLEAHVASAIEGAVLAERARAASMCDKIEAGYWEAYKRGKAPGSDNSYVRAQSDGAGECGTAIRAGRHLALCVSDAEAFAEKPEENAMKSTLCASPKGMETP